MVGRRGRLGDLYLVLLDASWPRVLIVFAVAFVAANAAFALAYLGSPEAIENARPGSFADAFFFSVQTMVTIGYGRMAPQSLLANVLVVVEAFSGPVGLAVMTGLIFAKFSRPTARVRFSRVAVVSRRDGIESLMLRMANERGNRIVEAQLHLVLARNETTAEGEPVRRFYDLDLVRTRSALFALTWTAVHPLTEQSPLHGVTPADLRAARAELIVSLVGFDETFSQTIHARHTYGPADLRWSVRFADVLVEGPDGVRGVDYARFDEVVAVG